MKIRQLGTPGTEILPISPSYFTFLSVANFRCFGDAQTLNLADARGRPARWTVIVGENGVGKTSLLQCLAGLASEYVASPHTGTTRGSSGKVEYVLSPKLGTMQSVPFIQDATRTEGVATNIHGGVAVGSKLTGYSKSDTATFKHWGLRITRSEKDRAAFNFTFSQDLKQQLSGLLVYGYGAGSRLPSNARGEQVGYDTTATLFDLRASLPNSEEWLLNLDHLAKTQTPLQAKAVKSRDRILEILKNVLPGVEGIAFDVVTDRSIIRPRFKIPYGAVTMDQLGVGYQSMIAWIADLVRRMVYRYPESDDPLAEPAIVLIDELDMHLHPAWQRKVMHYLSEKFPNAQFIATVHNPLVVQTAADAGNIAVLRPVEGSDGKMQIVIDNEPENVRGWRLDQILTSDLYGLPLRSENVEKLLHRRTVLLSKPRLAPKERAELAELNAFAHSIPTEQNAGDRRAMDVIDKAAQLLESLDKTAA